MSAFVASPVQCQGGSFDFGDARYGERRGICCHFKKVYSFSLNTLTPTFSYLLITFRSTDPRRNCCHSLCLCGHSLCIRSYNVLLLLCLPSTGEELPAKYGEIWTCNKSSLNKFHCITSLVSDNP